MKQAILLHNPGSGDEDHLKEDLIRSIEKEGFTCVYFSVSKGDDWKEQIDQADFAVVAGGDGTVRGVVKELVKRDALAKKIPIAILPMGTANNLSKALDIHTDLNPTDHIKKWKASKRQRFDVGVVKNVDSIDFFLEGAGYGVFPKLIQRMETVDKGAVENTADELKLALEVLHELILSIPAEKYWIRADNHTYEGKYLLLEVMNIPSIGPNLILSPDAVTDDGLFNIVCVEESQRTEFAEYIHMLSNNEAATFNWVTFTAKALTIDCESQYMHVDDELVLPLKNPVIFEVRENVLEFLTSTQ
jgi:diacylglycerol kinase (ATP)